MTDRTLRIVAGLVALAKREHVGLTIIGPEGPLVIGVVDAFQAAGLRCFGPHKAAAQLEGSKAFTKEFLKRHGIPTAAYATFTRETFDPAWVRQQRTPIVVKASGLAAGKGVVIVDSVDEASIASISFTWSRPSRMSSKQRSRCERINGTMSRSCSCWSNLVRPAVSTA